VKDQGRPEVRRALSVTYGHLADAQVDAGKLPDALESHRRSLDLRKALAAEFPDNADYEYLVGSAQYYMANVLSRMGRWKDALTLYQLNLAASPQSGFSSYRVGEALLQLGRPAQALGHFRNALRFHLKEFAPDSASLFNRLALAMDRSGICKALAFLHQPEAPGACATTAEHVLATPVDSTHAFARSHFGAIWFELGEAYENLSGWRALPAPARRAHRTAAHEMYRRSLDIWSDLTARKLIAPIDTFRVAAAAAAMKRVHPFTGPAARATP
jgi:tetratricopeptide (TPR) repeat protein